MPASIFPISWETRRLSWIIPFETLGWPEWFHPQIQALWDGLIQRSRWKGKQRFPNKKPFSPSFPIILLSQAKLPLIWAYFSQTLSSRATDSASTPLRHWPVWEQRPCRWVPHILHSFSVEEVWRYQGAGKLALNYRLVWFRVFFHASR